MSATGALVKLSPRDHDAVLFDLDGVLTPTASVHAAAWKKLFDDFLRKRSQRTGEPFEPFDEDADYRRYVDGKPRLEGVAGFLQSRHIELPEGRADEAPGERSMQALGKCKDRYFMESLQRQGIAPFEGVVDLVQTLRAQDVRTAVVSSSMNCAAVLEAAGIAHLFDTRVDGNDLVSLALAGKPAPDSFLEAARRLGVEPRRSVVVEDATVGVRAGRAGSFGYVIGVDRGGQSQRLREAGADVVVGLLSQIQVTTEPHSAWSLIYDDFDPAREGIRESLCALGNGYFTTRGAASWSRADGIHYPGTYLAGCYNRLRTDIAGRVVENEDLVNLPNWLAVGFQLASDNWFDERQVRILRYRQELDLRQGLLVRRMTFEDNEGRRTTLNERRLVSMADMHLGALEITLTAENWTGPVTVRSAVDGRIVNAGAKLYEPFSNHHLDALASEQAADNAVLMVVRTNQSLVDVAMGARTRFILDGEVVPEARRLVLEPAYIGQETDLQLVAGKPFVIEKIAVLHSSRDRAISEPAIAARKALERAETFEVAFAAHALAWKQLWRRFDVHLRPVGEFSLNVPMLLRLNMFHLLQAASLNSVGLDVGVPARGWTGEAYQGHIFWDELFILPTLTLRMPEITRSLLMYRYHRLDEARAAARAAGFRGAMFPWQSGSDGQEETQELNLNPRSRRWMVDNSYLQRHVGGAVAWNVWSYLQATHDFEFLQFYGAELILEVARFWASIATYDDARGRYEIRGVMGPDEFHDAYPGAPQPGLDNNAYTNVLAAWVLWRAQQVLERLPQIRRNELTARLGISAEETAHWDDMSRRMFIPFHEDDIISQFEGYERLEELDWADYHKCYGNIQRLDLILEAEGDSANRYKLSKQADVLMLFYLFSADELREVFERLGYSLAPESIPRNVAYYDARSSHGSTLSRVVHCWVLARSNRAKSMAYYAEALQSDVSDIQQGTTAEGVHLGAMAGTADLVQRVSTGIEIKDDVLILNPRLPEALERLDMRIRYRGHTLDLKLMRNSLTVTGREPGAPPFKLAVGKNVYEFVAGSVINLALPQ